MDARDDLEKLCAELVLKYYPEEELAFSVGGRVLINELFDHPTAADLRRVQGLGQFHFGTGTAEILGFVVLVGGAYKVLKEICADLKSLADARSKRPTIIDKTGQYVEKCRDALQGAGIPPDKATEIATDCAHRLVEIAAQEVNSLRS